MKTKITIAASVCVLILSAALFTGLFFGLKNRSDFNKNIHNLMSNVRLANENFIGFSFRSAQTADGAARNALGVRTSDSAAGGEADGFVAIDENFVAEDVHFWTLSDKKPKEITTEDIGRYGAVTRFCVMNNLLLIEITAREALPSREIAEDSYFTLGSSSAVFAVDLETKNVYSVTKACLAVGLTDAETRMYFSVRYGLFFTNPGIVGQRQETYLIQLRDNTFQLKKVADTANGEYVQDKYKNVYLIEDSHHQPDADEYDLNYVRLFTCDEKNYEYFLSSDRQIYRALQSDCKTDAYSTVYSTVESLQADKRWAAETSSSDRILRNQLTYSDSFQGGEWMLKDGKIVRIASYFNRQADCYNVDGKLIAHLKNETEETVLYIGDANEVASDFRYIDFYTDGYDRYEKIAVYQTDSPVLRYRISINGIGHVLTEYEGTSSAKKYKIAASDGQIGLSEIQPTYNGSDSLSGILFLE